MSMVFKNPYTDSIMWTLQGGLIMLTSDGLGLSIDSTDAYNMLAATLRIQIQQTRQVSTRMPLVGNTSIKIVSPPTGLCTLSTIIGPHHVIDRFMTIFGDACNTFTAYIDTVARANQICDGPFAGQKLILRGCVGNTTAFDLSIQLNVAVAQGTFRFAFDTLDWGAGNVSGV